MEKSLAPEHVADLQKSGLTPETIRTAGLYSVPPGDINKVLGRNGVNSLLAIPYPGTSFTRYRMFPPTKLGKDSKRPAKYWQAPGSPIYLYEPPGFDPNGPIIRITEGEKKSLKGTQDGLNVCGLGGIWSFASKDENEEPQLIEALKKIDWEGKRADLIPDGDFQTKGHVCHAVFRLGSMLQKAGAEVGVVRLPGDSKLDNFLCSHSVEAFSELEILTLDDRIFRGAMVKEGGLIVALRAGAMPIAGFLEREFPARPYILKPLLRPGTLCQIFSERGMGKTFLASAIAISATYGTPIGKWTSETPVATLYVDGEMGAGDFQTRLNSLTMGLPTPSNPLTIISNEVQTMDGWPRVDLSNTEGRDAIYSFVREGEYKLLILDNVAALTSSLDENSKQEWDDVNQWLLSLRWLGVAVITVHHAGKSGLQRGTSSREDALDVSLKLARPKGYKEEDGCCFNVSFAKARSVFGLDAAPFNFKITPQGNGLTWVVSDPEGGTKGLIMAGLGNGNTVKEIAQMLDINASLVYRIRKKGIADGLLEEDGKTCKFTEQGMMEYGGIKFNET